MSDKILVVDDSPEFLVLLTSLLKFHKIEVDSQKDSTKVLSMIEETEYSLIITDYMMEELNGLELIEKIIEKKANYRGKIILLTAKNLDEVELEKGKSLEATYITKPVMPNQLYKQITEMLGHA